MSELSLATELLVLQRSDSADTWLLVRTPDGSEGWVLGRLTTEISAERYDDTIEVVVRAQLTRNATTDVAFDARIQLLDLVERTLDRIADRERTARFALYRLQGMAQAFGGIPFRGDRRDPYATWLATHQQAGLYNDPAGRWMIDARYVKQVHDDYRDTAAADEIAWFYVGNRLPGECEGSVPCYVSWVNELEGWYLRAHSAGRYTNESNFKIVAKLNGAMDNLLAFPRVLAEFEPARRCGDLHASLDPLVAAVMGSASNLKPAALAAIDRFARLCR